MIGIYKIVNNKNGKIYIGQSNDIMFRLSQHMREIRNHNNTGWYDEVRKDNADITDFSMSIEELCEESQLDEREAYYINKYNSYFDGYNHTLGNTEQYKLNAVLRKEQEKNAIIGQKLDEVAKHFISIPLIGDARTRLLEDCAKFLRRSNGTKDFDLKLVLKEMKSRGYTVKRSKINQKHIKKYNLSQNLLRQDCYIIEPK